MKIRLATLFFLLLFLTTTCNKHAEFSHFNGFAQGTTYSVVFENNGEIDVTDLREKVEAILKEFDMSLSLYEDSSVLSRINRNETDVADSFFIEAFNKAGEIYTLTGGAFDITVGPLVEAWGFGPDALKNFNESVHDSLMNFTGMDKVELKDGRLYKDDTRIKLDFNAIAQGYSVDVISDYLKRTGIKNHLVEIGGEVKASGDKGGIPWRIGIDRPEENNMVPGVNLQAVISLKNRSLATSGNYRRFYVEDGVKYSHTIDPKTGYPARNRLLSATIIADECAAADGIATACMVMGLEKSIAFLERNSEYDAYLIYSDDKGYFLTWSTKSFKKFISEEQ